jgi:DNA-binding NarL/FixJ family response regulator
MTSASVKATASAASDRRLRPLQHSGQAPAGGPAARTVRVLVADGQELVRAGFRVLLDAAERVVVVGEAGDGEQAVALARRLRPDVVLVDAGLPGLGCVEATARLAAEAEVAVMLVAASEDDERIFPSLRAGAVGLLVKDAAPRDLVRAVTALAGGGALLSQTLTRRLIAELAARPEPSGPAARLLDQLTRREREVVTLVAHGLRNDEIAERLAVSRATAKTHVSRVMIKLGAHDRAKLVVFGYEAGLVAPRNPAPAPQPLALAS